MDEQRDAAQEPSTTDRDAAAEPGDAMADAMADATVDAGASAGEREQDRRTFTFDSAMAPFEALPNSSVETDRMWGVLDGAGYQIEIPKSWNGKLVMYAHGYVGAVPALRVTRPSIRRHLIESGYAWAASSYSRNWYDVRAGVEDTNKLALAFVKIAGDNGRVLTAPTKRYIIGHSMGGHVAGAAVERETADTAVNKVAYDGALPMCGVMGDSELFNYFAAYQLAAQHVANMPATAWPVAGFADIMTPLRAALFTTYPSVVTDTGAKLRDIVMNLTGGKRPAFELGFASTMWQGAVWMTFGGDGTMAGILGKNGVDTRDIVFQLDTEVAQTEEERTLNAAILRVTPEPDANALRADGLRWIPKVNGEFSVKVVTLHTLGDLYVPFKMQQLYRQRAEAKGNGDKLVQRAIRGVGHCEFAYTEQTAAFDAMVAWNEVGTKPEGDDVTNSAVVADANYGCKFTAKQFTPDEVAAGALPTARAAIAACTAP